MCGIAGFIDFSGKSDQRVLKNMTDAIVHRGPDGEGQWTWSSDEFRVQSADNVSIGLGHRRLAIIDLSPGGAQPMHRENLHITFNGEIYNFQEIKDELIGLGHTFQSHSDTEVILEAYRAWGISCLQRFIGMFAFTLFDEEKQEVYLVRDRAGVKPLFVYHKNDLLLFGSELKSFLAHPGFEKNLDLNTVAAFIQFGHVPTPHCIYKDCFKVKPGTYLKVNLSNKELEEHTYWSSSACYDKPKLNLSEAEAKEQTKSLLKSAFDYRMVSDVPVGVFLSGGYDSTGVTALLAESNPNQLKTYTISVPDIGLNEAAYAKETAQILGTKHQELECSYQEALDLIPTLPHFYDEPFADSSAIPSMLLSKWVKNEVTVALSADGGDELFAGYNRYDYLMKFGNGLNYIPSFLRKTLAYGMDKIPATSIPVLKDKYNFPNRYEKTKEILKNPSAEAIMLQLSRQYDDVQIQDLFLRPVKSLPNLYSAADLNSEYFTALSTMQAIDYRTYLVDDILQKVDRATMSASLEGREPFLDHRILEFVAQLPDELKYKKGIKKYLLREIVHDYIPQEKMNRPKMGFAIPIENWMMNELRPIVEECFSLEFIKQQGIFNPIACKKLKDAFMGGKMEYGFKVWYFVSFQLWYKKYMA